MENFNLQLFTFLNAGPSLNKTSLLIATFCANYFIYLIPVLLIISWLWKPSNWRCIVLLACMSTLSALLINYLIKLIWFHPRPFVVGIGHTFLLHSPDSSFPSDHMTIMWAVGLSFLIYSETFLLGMIILFMAILTGWARIYLGIHFPFDILGSIVISTFCILFLKWLLSEWIEKRLLPMMERIYQKMFAKLINLGWIKS